MEVFWEQYGLVLKYLTNRRHGVLPYLATPAALRHALHATRIPRSGGGRGCCLARFEANRLRWPAFLALGARTSAPCPFLQRKRPRGGAAQGLVEVGGIELG